MRQKSNPAQSILCGFISEASLGYTQTTRLLQLCVQGPSVR
jgi:hypothetical protein